VLFCHITSQVKEDKHQNLLSQRGGRGFPHLAFLDAEGLLLAVHNGQRTAAGFDETVVKAKAFVDLRKKAEAGDKAAKLEHFLQAMDLGHFTADELRKRAKELDLGKDHMAKVEAACLNMEIAAIFEGVTQDKTTWVPAGKKFAEMKKAGRVPTDPSVAPNFWVFIMEYAYSEKDAPLFEEGLAAMKERKARPQWVEAQEKRLAEIKEKK